MTINLRAVPRDQWPERCADVRRVAVFQDARLLVQVFEEDAQVVRISVNATALGKGGRWKDGLSWDVLQAIKDAVGYADRDAVEVFPARGDVVNVANMRHLWVLPERLSFVWRN